MLSERHYQLLTAFVDGRLSQRHREEAQRLLEKSASARAFLQQVQDNIQRLQELPKHTLEPEFASQVIAWIEGAAAAPPAVIARPRPVVRALPSWLGPAVAASLLLAVTASSYLFFSAKNRPEPDQEIEQPVTLANFNRVAFQEKVAAEVRKGKGVHLDLTYQNGPQAVERLRRAFEQSGIKLLPGPLNADGELVVYAEDINADELGGIVSQLSAEEQRSHQFDVPQVQPFTAQEHRQVASSLGLKSLENEDDLFKNPMPAPTKDKRSSSKKSTTPPPVTPAVKDRMAIVLARGSGQGTPAAIGAFLANRASARPGAFSVVLVLRPANA